MQHNWSMALTGIQCTNSTFICENHFEKECFILKKTTKLLKKESIPTIFDNIGNTYMQ